MDVDAIEASLETDGYAIVPAVLSPTEAGDATQHLWAASKKNQQDGHPAHIEALDPNESSVRVIDLLAADPLFIDLIGHPVTEIVARHLGPDYIISNFTANIARPGALPMVTHSDQAVAGPEPWITAWSMNLMWCLSDMHAANGATRYIPGSHRWKTRDDVPADLESLLVPFEAGAGSVIAMDGRLWHTSGANVTRDEDRPLLFAYYCLPFIRPRWNFSNALDQETQSRLSPRLRYQLGLDLLLSSRWEDSVALDN